MVVCKALQILLIGAELLGLGHLRLVANAHLCEEYLAELARRVDVEARLAGLLSHLSLEFHEASSEFDCILVKQRRVDADSREFHLGQHIYHRLLDIEVEVEQPLLLDKGQKCVLELQSDVGILGCILRNTLYGNQIHCQLLGSSAYEGLYLDRGIVEVSQSELIHSVA